MDYESLMSALRLRSPKEEKVIRLRYGLGRERALDPWEIGEMFDVSVRRIEQILSAAERHIKEYVGVSISVSDLRAAGRWAKGVRDKRPLITFRNEREQAYVRTGALRLFDELTITQEKLLQLTSRQFEELVAEIWERLGYSVELTKQTRDGGADIIAIRKSEAEIRFLVLTRYAGLRLSRPFCTPTADGNRVRSQEAEVLEPAMLRSL